MIFRLVSPVVKKPPCVRGTAQEYFEPCLPGEAPIFSYPDSCFASQTLLPPEPKVAIAPLPEVQTCPRPRSPTPPPPPPPPKRASPEYVRPPRRLSTVLFSILYLLSYYISPSFPGFPLTSTSYDANTISAAKAHLQDQILNVDGIVHPCKAGLRGSQEKGKLEQTSK